jgi:MFS family permease
VYRFWVFLHVAGVFGFLLAHGSSAVVAFQLRKERELPRVAALLDLSSASLGLLYGSLLLLLASGIVAGFLGHWWGQAWIWTAIGVLLALMVAMYVLASPYFNGVREAVGVQTYDQRRKDIEAGPPASPERIEEILRSSRPLVVAVIGVVGLLIILWLMMFKPF